MISSFELSDDSSGGGGGGLLQKFYDGVCGPKP